MTAPGGGLVLQLVLNTARAQQQLQRDMARAGQQSGTSFSTSFRSSVGDLGKALIPAAGAGAIVGGLKKAVESALSLNAAVSANRQVFKSSSGEMEAWAKNAAQTMGLAKGEALSYAKSLGALFISQGQTIQSAALMSKSLVEAGVALSAFADTDVASAQEAVAAGFRGEYDSLQKFLPQVSDATVSQQALSMGLAKTSAGLTAANKATALSALILNAQQTAAGAAEQKQGSLTISLNKTKAALTDQAASIGQRMLPALAGMLSAANNVGLANIAIGTGAVLLARQFAGVTLGLASQAGGYAAVVASSAVAEAAAVRYAALEANVAARGGVATLAQQRLGQSLLLSAGSAQAAAASQTGLGASLARTTIAWRTNGAGATLAAVVTNAATASMTAGMVALDAAILANPIGAVVLLGTATLGLAYAAEKLEKAGHGTQAGFLAGQLGAAPLLLDKIQDLMSSTDGLAKADSDAVTFGKQLADTWLKDGEAAAYAASKQKLLNDEDLGNRAAQYKDLGGSIDDYSQALAGNQGAQQRVNEAFNQQIASIENLTKAEQIQLFGSEKGYQEHLASLRSNRDATNETADAERARMGVIQQITGSSAALTGEQQKLVDALKVVGSETATATERADGLRKAYDLLYKSAIDQNEAEETRVKTLSALHTEMIEDGSALDLSTAKTFAQKDAVLENRDALEAALLATRDKAAADVEAGLSIDQVNVAHRANIQAILDTIPPAQRNSAVVQQMVAQYGSIPTDVKTGFAQSGQEAVKETFRSILKDVEYLLKNGFLPPVSTGDSNRAIAGQKTNTKFSATGGRLRGPGGPTGDKIPVMASDDEFVIKAVSARKLGYGTLDYMNEQGSLPHFATGGRVRPGIQSPGVLPFERPGGQDPSLMDSNLRFVFAAAQAATLKTRVVAEIKKRQAAAAAKAAKDAAAGTWSGLPGEGVIGSMQRFALAQRGKVYGWATQGPNTFDCSGLVSNLYAIATGRALNTRYFSTQNEPLPGWQSGPGQFTIYLGPGHTAANIGGLHAEAYHGNGTPLAIGHIGTPLSYYTSRWHLPGLAEGGRVDAGTLKTDPRARFESFLEHGWPEPPMVFDSGGWLKPKQTAINMGSTPERILPSDTAMRLDDYSIAKLAQAISARPAALTIDGSVVAEKVFSYLDVG